MVQRHVQRLHLLYHRVIKNEAGKPQLGRYFDGRSGGILLCKRVGDSHIMVSSTQICHFLNGGACFLAASAKEHNKSKSSTFDFQQINEDTIHLKTKRLEDFHLKESEERGARHYWMSTGNVGH